MQLRSTRSIQPTTLHVLHATAHMNAREQNAYFGQCALRHPFMHEHTTNLQNPAILPN